MTVESDVLDLSVADDKESMEARGNVVLKNRDRVGYAETAYLEAGTPEYDEDGQLLIKEGSPLHLHWTPAAVLSLLYLALVGSVAASDRRGSSTTR